MPHEIRKYLRDIQIHIGYIEDFLGNKSDFTSFQRDLATQYAVQRALEIIGEAANSLRKQDATIAISNLRQIVATRNILIHAYDSVDPAIVWSIIKNHLPMLKTEIEQLLINYSNPEN
ncbi:DUF86 domain-containing protein [Larkinella sp. VNQ87]|uniref:HepT-like ribonuclease domain-containing protein n=1 Tax=Larkinella sp. VNQ87 TaxID=3400921 RepID=UPI003BFB6FF4